MCVRFVEHMGQAVHRVPTAGIARQRLFGQAARGLETVDGVMRKSVLAKEEPVIAVSSCQACEVGKLLPLPIRSAAPGVQEAV